MAQLSVPRFDSLFPASDWLPAGDRASGDVMIVVLAARHVEPSGRLTRLPPDFRQVYRVKRDQTRFSWRSAWLGALAALGLVGFLAAAAQASQAPAPIRIALPLPRPVAALTALPAAKHGLVMKAGTRRSAGISSEQKIPALTPDDPAALAAAPLLRTVRPSDSGTGEFFRANLVQAAAQHAILSGVAQTWAYGGLTGYVVAGPLDLSSNRACHRIALWAEQKEQPGASMAFTSCLTAQGNWKSPPGPELAVAGDAPDDSRVHELF